MRGTSILKAVAGTAPPHRPTTTTTDQWREYCQAVSAAAEQLRLIALRAECAMGPAASAHDPLRAIARDIGLALLPSRGSSAQTYRIMMLGPFAALEELRRQITS